MIMQPKKNLLNIIIDDLIRYKNKADYLIYVAQLQRENLDKDNLLDLKDYLVSRTVFDKEFSIMHKSLLSELDYFLSHKVLSLKVLASYGFIDFYEINSQKTLIDWLIANSANLKLSSRDVWLLLYRAHYNYNLSLYYIIIQGFTEGSSVKIILITTDFEPFNQALLEHCYIDGFQIQNMQMKKWWT